MEQNFLNIFNKIAYNNSIALVSNNNKQITWRNYYSKCVTFSNFLKSYGVQKNESVAIMGFNSPEWFYSAIGTLLNGSTYVGIYPTNGPEEVEHVLNISNATILVIQDNKLLDNIKLQKKLKKIVIYNDEPVSNEHNSISVSKFSDIIKNKYYPSPNNEPNLFFNNNDIATYIMTSGTTGKSKAVKITYNNISYTCSKMTEIYNLSNEKVVSYLPLSHIAASMFDMFCHFYHKGTIYFAKQDALQGSLGSTLVSVNPTIFLGVPRVWEKISEKMQLIAAEKYRGWAGQKLKSIIDYFKDRTLSFHQGETSKWNYLMHKISKYLFFNRVKTALGFQNCKLFFSGAAPISIDTLNYFCKIDIIIYEIFGMSETCGVITANNSSGYRKGSVGKSLIGELKIAEDGEILYKGVNNFIGYKDNDDATNEILDNSNWLHTGDVGKIDNDGYLFITGRKKELIITAGGENIAPVIIENNIKKYGPNILQVIVIGDKRKFLSALIYLPHKEEEIIKCEQYIKNAIDQYNNNDAISSAQKIQKYTLINDDFTVENGLMTTTMKLKRSNIHQRYQNDIENMYNI